MVDSTCGGILVMSAAVVGALAVADCSATLFSTGAAKSFTAQVIAAAETVADLISWANLAARQIEVLLAEEQSDP